MFSGSVKMVGKMRIRLSTLRANTPLNLSMPLQGKLDSTIGHTVDWFTALAFEFRCWCWFTAMHVRFGDAP